MGHNDLSQISIVISSRGGHSLDHCLSSIDKVTDQLIIEILVVVDNLQDINMNNLTQNITKFRLKFYETKCRGVSAARNLGIQKSTGEIIILIDDDCHLENTNLLSNIYNHCLSSTKLNGGTYSLDVNSSYFARSYNLVNFIWLKLGKQKDATTEHLLGGFLFAHKSIMKNVIFNQKLLWGGEETEMIKRLKSEKNISSQLTELKILHRDNTGILKFIKRAYFQGKGKNSSHNNGLSITQILGMTELKYLPGLIIFYFFSRLGILIRLSINIFRPNIKPNP